MMHNLDEVLCPIPGLGYCLYERCPYWDEVRRECDAACLQENPAAASGEAQDFPRPDAPCTIHWSEDND